MTKNYYFQVIPVVNPHFLWCESCSFFTLGNRAIIQKYTGFLHIINLFINKNMYYENTLQKKS